MHHYIIITFKMLRDRIEVDIYKIDKERVAHFSQFMSIKVKKTFKISQAQFREKLRKLRLM